MFPNQNSYSQFRGNSDNQFGDNSDFTLIDYIIVSSPHSVMKVLSRHGYVGYLAPNNFQELSEATYDFIDKEGEDAVIELIKSHPLYEIVVGIEKEGKPDITNYKNASGEESTVVTTLKTIDFTCLIKNALVIIGAFYLANLFLKFLNKE